MREYIVLEEKIVIPDSTENFVYYMNFMKDIIESRENVFNKWYDSQRDCVSVAKNADDILEKIIYPVIDRGTDYLIKKDICDDIFDRQSNYIVGRDVIKRNYLSMSLNLLNDIICDMFDEIQNINNTQQAAKQYRELRKESRGRFVGGGFGITGALKGAAEAAMLNAASGMLHSVGNTMGNMGTAVTAVTSKASLFKKYKKILLDEILEISTIIIIAIPDIAMKRGNIQFDFKINNQSPNADSAKTIMLNYKKGIIPVNDKKLQLLNALKNDPQNLNIYSIIWNEYIEDMGDLKNMAKFFNVPLEDEIDRISVEHCEGIYKQYCNEYISSKNPVMAAIEIEPQIIKAVKEITEYCQRRDIELTNIAVLDKCYEALSKVEKRLKIVAGIEYDSRKHADQIKNDRKIFYDYLKKQEIEDVGVLEGLQNLKYESFEYQNNLLDIYKREIDLRNYNLIFTNIQNISRKYFTSGKTKAGNIETASIDENFERKANFIRSITNMPENESPILLINFSTDGKSGLLLTNFAVRVYAKALLFSNKNLIYRYEDIDSIECAGNNRFIIRKENLELRTFDIDYRLNIDEQNLLCDFLNEAVFIITNLNENDRINLNNIKCECGTYLAKNEKICPVCKKMYLKEKGVFVETVECTYCKNRIQVGKKFCKICGKSQIDTVNITDNRQLGQATTAYCSQCGSPVLSTSNFCSKCGARIAVKQ